MPMNYATVQKLATRFHEREILQKLRERALKPDFWSSSLACAIEQNPLYELASAVGGQSELLVLIQRAVDAELEKKMKEHDAEIARLGGTP